MRRKAREAEPGELDERRVIERAEEQMSLFAALSSTVLGDHDDTPHDGIDPQEDLLAEPADSRAFTIELPPPPPLPPVIPNGRTTEESPNSRTSVVDIVPPGGAASR